MSVLPARERQRAIGDGGPGGAAPQQLKRGQPS